MNDTYASPQSNLVETSTAQHSLEDAIAGNYQLDIGNVFSEAWNKTNGIKRYIIGAGAIMYALFFAAVFVITLIFNPSSEPSASSILAQMVIQLIFMVIIIPFLAGIFMMSAKKAQGQPFEFGDAFSGYGKTIPLLIAAILMNILATIGFILLIIPGIYLSIAYMFTVPLVIDRNMSPWQAMETSRKAVTKHWFKFLLLLLAMTFVMLISAIPLGIGLIWTAPMMALAYAITYREVFGLESV